jgi:predicted RNA-binding protein with PIN domain
MKKKSHAPSTTRKTSEQISTPLPLHILVDGHNIIHASAELKKTLLQFGIDAAQARMVEAARILHDMRGMRVTIVFDGKSHSTEANYLTADKILAVVHTAKGVSADAFIEHYVAQNKNPDRIRVATHDLALSALITGFGAYPLSAEDFLKNLEQTQKEQSQMLARPNRPGAQKLGTIGDLLENDTTRQTLT